MPEVCDVKANDGFDVIFKTSRSEAATMVLSPGETTGGPHNNHANSDQWMLVLEGEGEIIIDKEKIDLYPQRLVLIRPGENHEVRNSGESELRTLNFYAPPEY